jgi:hypothetical protein
MKTAPVRHFEPTRTLGDHTNTHPYVAFRLICDTNYRSAVVCIAFAVEVASEPGRGCPRAFNVRLVIRYQGSATIRQGKTVIEGDCVVESGGDQLAEPDLPWSGRFHDPTPRVYLEEGRAWLRLNDEPIREGAIKITRAGAGPGAGLIDFDGIGSLR